MSTAFPYRIRPEETEIAAWNRRFQDETPQTLLSWAAERWGSRLALTCSFGGAAGMVLLDMILKVAPATPVVYVDTGLLFPETYALIARVQEHYGKLLQPVYPKQSVTQQAAAEGASLWTRDPDRCCGLRKVQPLAEVLAPFNAWIAGLRRDGGPTRANVRLLEWSNKHNLVKLNPLAFWNERDVWRYIHKHDVPYNTLLDQGYTSIGCVPCTRLPVSDDVRSGRWAGFNKTECGLHVER